MMGVPTFYVRLVQDARLDEEATRHMRLFISGSAPLLAETHREWSERTGHDVLERYGMTETNMITSNPYVGKRVPGSVGFPLPGTELRIADDTGAPVPQGEIGMIEVRGAQCVQRLLAHAGKNQNRIPVRRFFSSPATWAKSIPKVMSISSAAAKTWLSQADSTCIPRKWKR